MIVLQRKAALYQEQNRVQTLVPESKSCTDFGIRSKILYQLLNQEQNLVPTLVPGAKSCTNFCTRKS